MRNAWPAQPGRYAITLALMLFFIVGCSREDAEIESKGDDSELRIVSFMPSATRIVVDLGLSDRIVGVAEHDAAAPAINADGDPMPIVGHFMDVDVERLMSLRPTHVIFPVTSEDATPSALNRYVASGGRLVMLAYPNTLDEVVVSVKEIGKSLGQANRGFALSDRLAMSFRKAEQFQAVVEHIKSQFNNLGGGGAIPGDGSVLLAFGVDPVVASGPGSINHELLVLLGYENAVGDAAVSAVTLDREALIDVNPSVIVLLLPGASTADADDKIAWFDALPIAAVKDHRVHALTDPQVLLPGTNLPETLAVLQEVLRATEAGSEVSLPSWASEDAAVER
ncbi:MAG: ABC transporter substrate-binding protein [Planctomycetota bacterium]